LAVPEQSLEIHLNVLGSEGALGLGQSQQLFQAFASRYGLESLKNGIALSASILLFTVKFIEVVSHR